MWKSRASSRGSAMLPKTCIFLSPLPCPRDFGSFHLGRTARYWTGGTSEISPPYKLAKCRSLGPVLLRMACSLLLLSVMLLLLHVDSSLFLNKHALLQALCSSMSTPPCLQAWSYRQHFEDIVSWPTTGTYSHVVAAVVFVLGVSCRHDFHKRSSSS